MKIGIDAKRIFKNKSGLGSYGRNLLHGLNQIDQKNKYFLYTTEKKKLFDTKFLHKNFVTKECNSSFKSLWRTTLINKDLRKDQIDLYHGISNELPFGITKNIQTIVDIHDLLFLRFPNFYSVFDRKIFELKTKYACKHSHKILATSIATKEDIVKFYNINPQKIEVVYQSCNDSFFQISTEEDNLKVTKKYNLPKEYILCVGTLQERKNQLQILEALNISKHKIPLVLVGGGSKEYKNKLVTFAKKNKLTLIIPKQFVEDKDLPTIYQKAKLFVFPGLYEGFGIPVVEAMASKIPVITSFNTSMAEIVQDLNCLINPLSVEDIADKIDTFLENSNQKLIAQNYQRALEFTNIKFASRVLKIYNEFGN